jgi:hypothetical protein
MPAWRNFPDKSWSELGGVLSGYGTGEGTFGLAYTIETDSGRFLNGRVCAEVRIASDRSLVGAGVVARADDLRSFVVCYVISDSSASGEFSLRLAAFKLGSISSHAALKEPIKLPSRHLYIGMQFFSGDIVGEVVSGTETYRIARTMPEVAFPGYCGVARFYNTTTMAKKFQAEKLTMNPILPENLDDRARKPYRFDVFLSHSSADKHAVAELSKALNSEGITYWVDHEQINFGDPIVSKIEDGLRNSKYVIACTSTQFANSGWCRAEYGPILYREFSGDTTRRVIPLSLDGSNDKHAVPLLLSDKMRVNFADRSSFAAFVKFLRGPQNPT